MSVDAIEGVEYDKIVQNGPKKVILISDSCIIAFWSLFSLEICMIQSNIDSFCCGKL